MTITVNGFKDVLDMLKSLFAGLKSVAGPPEASHRAMRDALADTTELFDQTLTILKKHLLTVSSELKFGDESKARRLVYELGNIPAWEEKYRRFQISDLLRASLFNMQRSGVFDLTDKVGSAGAQSVQQRMHDYIGSEANAATLVSAMLAELSALADTKYTRDNIVGELEDAIKEVLEWRQKFFDLEQQIRSAI